MQISAHLQGRSYPSLTLPVVYITYSNENFVPPFETGQDGFLCQPPSYLARPGCGSRLSSLLLYMQDSDAIRQL